MQFYERLSDETQQQIIRECYQLISKRDDNVCNFLEGGSLYERDTKLVYRSVCGGWWWLAGWGGVAVDTRERGVGGQGNLCVG